MLKKLTSTEALVKYILERCPEARDSFNTLYLIVAETLNPDTLRMSFKTVLQNLNALGLPPFETVRRTKQKVVAKHPELAASDDVQMVKDVIQEEYENYAVDKGE